jgi:hypothetical protein
MRTRPFAPWPPSPWASWAAMLRGGAQERASARIGHLRAWPGGKGLGRHRAGQASQPEPRHNKDRKVYLKFGPFTGGSKAADASLLGLLRDSLKQSLEKLPNVIRGRRCGRKEHGQGRRPAFLVDGNVLKLQDSDAGSALETSCEVKVMVARWPSRSVILWTSAGAAVQGGKRDRDKQNARRDCIEASAGQLGDSLVGYFKSQGG